MKKKKKELKIKYELENNLRLVSFKNQRIEISFNSNLDKSFIKDLSAKLLEWTNVRWIITFSQENGLPSLKEQKKNMVEVVGYTYKGTGIGDNTVTTKLMHRFLNLGQMRIRKENERVNGIDKNRGTVN